MEYELTCCVCLDLFKEPVTLPCSHSLCRSCMNKVANTAAYPVSLRPFDCPTCRFHVQRQHFKELKENKLLSNIVASYRKEKETTGAVPQMVCYIHPTEQLLLYCRSCKKAICSYCVTETHFKYSHRVSYIEHLIEQEKESVAKMLKETEQNLQEKKAKLIMQKNAVQNEKEAGEKMGYLLMQQLKTRLAKIKSDYLKKIDVTVQDLTATEKVIESHLNEFKVFSAAFDSMTYKPDRHLQYMRLTSLGKELLTFSLSVSMSGSLQVKERQLPKFALSNFNAIQEAIQALGLIVSDRRPEEDHSLEELIEQSLEDENLRAVFDRVMKRRNTVNIQKSKQVLNAGIQVSEPSVCVTNPASKLTTTYSADSTTTATSVGQPVSSAASVTSALVMLVPSALTPTTRTSRTFPLVSPRPSGLCEKLKTTLEDFLKTASTQKQSCNAGDRALSVVNPDPVQMEISSTSPNFQLAGTTSAISCGLPVPVLDSFQASQLKQAVTSEQGTPFGGSLPSQSVPSTSNASSTTSAVPLFMTSILSSGRSSCPQDSVPGNSTSDSSGLLSNLSNSESCQQSSLQPVSASLVAPVLYLQPEASASTFAALERNFLTVPVFNVGAAGEEQERTPKKAVKRMSRKFFSL